jgi:hypothetical protein
MLVVGVSCISRLENLVDGTSSLGSFKKMSVAASSIGGLKKTVVGAYGVSNLELMVVGAFNVRSLEIMVVGASSVRSLGMMVIKVSRRSQRPVRYCRLTSGTLVISLPRVLMSFVLCIKLPLSKFVLILFDAGATIRECERQELIRSETYLPKCP